MIRRENNRQYNKLASHLFPFLYSSGACLPNFAKQFSIRREDETLPSMEKSVSMSSGWRKTGRTAKESREQYQKVWRKLEAKGWNVIIVWECELEKSRLEETVFKVAKEIKENGELFNQRKEERRAERERYRRERAEKAQKAHTLERILSHSL